MHLFFTKIKRKQCAIDAIHSSFQLKTKLGMNESFNILQETKNEINNVIIKNKINFVA